MIELSEDFRRQLIEIAAYLGSHNQSLADRFLRSVQRTLERIVEYPHIGRLLESRRKSLRGVRFRTLIGFSEYLLFYRPTRSGIQALHLAHGARDIRSMLEDE